MQTSLEANDTAKMLTHWNRFSSFRNLLASGYSKMHRLYSICLQPLFSHTPVSCNSFFITCYLTRGDIPIFSLILHIWFVTCVIAIFSVIEFLFMVQESFFFFIQILRFLLPSSPPFSPSVTTALYITFFASQLPSKNIFGHFAPVEFLHYIYK